MNRFQTAVMLDAGHGLPAIVDLAGIFFGAYLEASAEGFAPEDDPAVLILAAYVAFAARADVHTPHYPDLLRQCRLRANEPPTPPH